MTDHITLPRSVVEQAIEALKLGQIRSVSEWEVTDCTPKPIKQALEALRAALADAAPTTATVRYDLAPTLVEGVIRDKLIDMGWAPPGAAQADPVAWQVYIAQHQRQYVVDDIDDAQLVDDCTNHDAVVTPLYTAPQPAQPVPQGWKNIIPGRLHTDEWDSARVSDYNNGWNDCQRKVVLALEAAAPTPPAAKLPVLEPLPQGWDASHPEPWESLTEEAQQKFRVCVKRNAAPFCGPDGVRQWTGPTLEEALGKGMQAIEAAHAAKLAKRGGV